MAESTTNAPVVKRHRSIHQKVQALDLYLNSGKTLHQIAEFTGVSYGTLNIWSHKGKWPEIKANIEREIREKLIHDTIRFQADHRAAVLKRHVELGAKFEDEVERKLKEVKSKSAACDSRTLSDIGKAMQSGTTVAARAVGIDRFDVQNERADTKINLLINTNLNPTPATLLPGKTFDVDVEPDLASSEPEPF